MARSLRELKPSTRWLGTELEVHDTVASTNLLAEERARSGAPDGTVVLADRQTAGRGRLGRSFFSPGGRSLYLSVLLRPPCPPEPWVVLACVKVDDEGNVTVINHCKCRRMVVSFADLWWRCEVPRKDEPVEEEYFIKEINYDRAPEPLDRGKPTKLNISGKLPVGERVGKVVLTSLGPRAGVIEGVIEQSEEGQLIASFEIPNLWARLLGPPAPRRAGGRGPGERYDAGEALLFRGEPA